METTDEELVVAYLAGQEDVFPVLMDRYLRSLYGFVFQLVRSDSAAEDIVQETFIKTWKNLSRFDVKKVSRPGCLLSLKIRPMTI